MVFRGPRDACIALDKMADVIGNPIVEAIRNTRSLTEAETLFLVSVVENTLTNVFTGDDMHEVRAYIHRPIKKEN